jgi:hypothetical protein
MIDKEALSNPGSRMDFNARQKPGNLGNETGNDRNFNDPQGMGDPMQEQSIEAGI